MDVSVIIPCYNSGTYLREAVESVAQLQGHDRYAIETIIVDDGSTDLHTRSVLSDLEKENHKVYFKPNGGPASARNLGASKTSGKYLLFLDSDNRLKPSFVTETIKAMQDNAADIVHVRSDFFGDSTEARFNTGEFHFHEILRENYIDICSLVERTAFEKIGRLDEDRSIIGFEDWEFYLNAYSNGLKLHFLDQALYSYRVTKNSLSQTHTAERLLLAKAYVYKKYITLFIDSYNYFYQREMERKFDRQHKLAWLKKAIYRRLTMKARVIITFFTKPARKFTQRSNACD